MKLTRQNSQRGSAFLVSLVGGVLIGTVLCSYLVLVTNRDALSLRATAWNAAMPVLEAGIEEALTHLHEDSNNPTANGWQQDQVNGQTVYWKCRFLPDGSYYCVTNFDITSTTPYIQSAGFVPAPLRDGQFISRLVQVTLTNPPSEFSRAIAANGSVQLSGGSTVDGYSSALGAYDVATNRNASGGIATDSQQASAINVGSAHVYGTAVTGPGGTVSVSDGAVGDVSWNDGNNIGPESGWVDDTMNVTFIPNSAPEPNPTFLPPMVVSAGGSNVTYLTGGTYELNNFVSNDKSQPMIVIGNATLWVPGNFFVNGSGYIYVAPGAKLQLYVGGTDPKVSSVVSISGGGIVNGTGTPANLSIFGLPSCNMINYSGQADFVGTMNAPQANVNFNGNASIYGAIIANTFTSSGTTSVHYDQALAGAGILTVTSWREL
jgi:hypothetical protein